VYVSIVSMSDAANAQIGAVRGPPSMIAGQLSSTRLRAPTVANCAATVIPILLMSSRE
jgi:hypothetical protein